MPASEQLYSQRHFPTAEFRLYARSILWCVGGHATNWTELLQWQSDFRRESDEQVRWNARIGRAHMDIQRIADQLQITALLVGLDN